MKRLFDLILAVVLLIILFIPIIFIILLIKLSSEGPVLYWSNRVGKDDATFKMPKFRSMKVGTSEVATHLLKNPGDSISKVGSFLRRNSLDEIPQLYSIISGSMSFIGPRPALFNQYDLIQLRKNHGLNKLRPGLTGWAQVNGRDKLSIDAKVKFDLEYLENKSILLDCKILIMTFIKVFRRGEVSH